jgi:hypothetical protein
MSFSDDINKFAKKAIANGDQVVRKTVLDITTSIMELSPVGNPSLWQDWNKGGAAKNKEHWLVKAGFVGEGYSGGHFRANWQLGIGALPNGIVEGIDKSGMATLSKANALIPKDAAGKVYYYANNLPYADALEHGHSHQAPYGMVGLTKLHFRNIIDRATGELK